MARHVRDPGTPKLIVLLACGVAVTIGLISSVQAHRKVVYHGRSLVEWQAALFDTSAGVRDTAVYALTRLTPASPSALAAVIRAEGMMLGDGDADVRSEATSALVALHHQSRDVVPMVADVLDQSANRNARVQAIQVLAALGADASAATPIVIRALDDSSATVRLVAVAALGRIDRGADHIGVVAHAAADVDADVRAAAIETLVALDAPPDTLFTVAGRHVHDPDPTVRAQVAYAFMAIGHTRDATPELEQMASDTDREVRRIAADVLLTLRHSRAPATIRRGNPTAR